MTELHLSLEHAGAGTDRPGHDGLGDLASLDGLNDAVLLNTTDLTEQDQDLALRLVLVAHQMVDEGSTRVAVTADSNTLVDTVGVLRNDVVQLVGHTTGLGNVTDGTLAVELGGDNVVHHTTSVTNLVGTRLDTADGGRTDDGDALGTGSNEDFTSTLKLLAAFFVPFTTSRLTLSGTPSAMMAMDLIWGYWRSSIVEE